MSEFWDRVDTCNHERHLSSDYAEFIHCPTPYCEGTETHCTFCGVYISECGCGYSSGMSGWPRKRYR